jgi:hypothetical protein
MTAGELVAAMQMAREVEQAQRPVPGEAKAGKEPVAEPAAAAVADENITALSAARHAK